MRDLFRALLVAFLLVIKELVGDKSLGGALKSWGIPEWTAPFLLIGALVIVYLVIDQIVFNAAHFPLLRGWFFPFSNLEGYWYQKVDLPDRPHSVSRLKHSLWAKTWTYEGTGYSRDYERAARWASKPIEYYDDKEFWLFRGVSTRIENGNEIGSGNVVSVLYLSTCDPDVGSAHRLFGRVLDLDFEDAPTGFSIELRRITADDWKLAGIKKAHKLDHASAEKLIAVLAIRP